MLMIGIDAREHSKSFKNIELRGHETCNYKEYRAATAENFTLTLCVANICNQEQAIPFSHNNK